MRCGARSLNETPPLFHRVVDERFRRRRWLGRPWTPEAEVVLDPRRCWGRVASVVRSIQSKHNRRSNGDGDGDGDDMDEEEIINQGEQEENEEFMDVIAGADVDCALSKAHPGRERVVMLLACHLGMRVGAIARLRLYGIVEDLKPGLDVWRVGDRLRGRDKNNQINEWMVSLSHVGCLLLNKKKQPVCDPSPVLREEMEAYIATTWRPLYEQWRMGRSGNPILVNHFLFPSPRPLRPRSDVAVAVPRALKTDTVTKDHHPP